LESDSHNEYSAGQYDDMVEDFEEEIDGKQDKIKELHNEIMRLQNYSGCHPPPQMKL